MKLIDTKEYKGFKTEFFLLPKTKKFLLEQGVNIEDYLMDNFHRYEHIMFDLLDPNLDENWSEKKETRKNFKVVLYGIIKRWIDKEPEGFIEDFEFDKEKVFNDSHMSIHPENKSPFAIREKILID
ncbi:hypothetical protein COU54_02080 [Candidatus Pacearchaeota archaeon CG10_big_fil_rev_8_21_14_0_10_31_24]|nr:MAG: hypothetical protein COU54_02080 [Candidatus Pacearchaeota archaeon CG10_big_fil_rev_8_21_14_0_10_31_24]